MPRISFGQQYGGRLGWARIVPFERLNRDQRHDWWTPTEFSRSIFIIHSVDKRHYTSCANFYRARFRVMNIIFAVAVMYLAPTIRKLWNPWLDKGTRRKVDNILALDNRVTSWIYQPQTLVFVGWMVRIIFKAKGLLYMLTVFLDARST